MSSLMEERSDRSARAGETSAGPGGDSLGFILDRLLRSFEDLGEGFSSERNRVARLKERLIEERLHLAVLGQFKRGKSTLMNAFLGEMLLPTSVVPVTSIPTFLRAGPKRLVRILFLDGKTVEFLDLSLERAAQILADYVTEERNPTNKLGVASVDVEDPSSFLSRGVVMIDTPGIGSTFRHNTEATLNFLPHCDAALFMVSADPPITEVEVEFLNAVRSRVARLFFVMNKVDYLTEAERKTAEDFFRKVLQEQVGFNGNEPLFSVSARQGLQARLGQNEVLWQESGLKDLQTYLLDFVARDKAQTLQSALASRAVDAVADAIMRIRLERRSLQMPLEDLQQRIQVFDEKMAEMGQERTVIGDLLAGDRKRAADFLEQRAEELRRKARHHLELISRDALQKAEDPGAVEQRVQACLAEEIPVFFDVELRSFSSAIDGRIQEVLRPHQDRVEELIGSIHWTAAQLFDVPYHAPHSVAVYEITREPYWVTYNWDASLGALPAEAIDRFLPGRVRMRRVRRRISEDIETLVVRNVENIRWATLRNLDDAFRRFASELDDRLRETLEATHGAFQAAHLRRKQQGETVQPEMQRLGLKETELAALEEALAKFTDSPKKAPA